MHYHIIVTDAVWISTFFLSLVYAIVLPTPLCTANVFESIYTRCGVVVRLRRSAKTLCERISGRRRCGRLRVIWRARRTFTLLRICSTAAAAATSLWSMATRGCRRRTSRPRRRGRVLAPWCRQRPLWLQQLPRRVGRRRRKPRRRPHRNTHRQPRRRPSVGARHRSR